MYVNKLENVIYYITKYHRKKNPQSILNRTKLIKLLYITYRETADNPKYTYPVPDIDFTKYYYGPYSDDIIDAIQEMDSNHIVHEHKISTESGSMYSYMLCNCPSNNFTHDLTDSEVDIIENVYDNHGTQETSELVRYVLELPEVSNSRKYEPISASDIRDS